MPGSEAIGAHCCWTYLIIAFHFVLGKRRKLNANLHDTNSNGGACREGERGRGRDNGNNHTNIIARITKAATSATARGELYLMLR